VTVWGFTNNLYANIAASALFSNSLLIKKIQTA
jgi:hypothetical protein